MEAIRKYTLEELHFPVDGYTHLVKTWTSVDGGETFYYCGLSKYFTNEAEALRYKAEREGGKIMTEKEKLTAELEELIARAQALPDNERLAWYQESAEYLERAAEGEDVLQNP